MGLPPISSVMSFVMWLAAAATLVVSCVREEMFWLGLMVVISAIGVSFVEGLVVFLCDVVDGIIRYRKAWMAHDKVRCERCKSDFRYVLRNEKMAPFIFVGFCVMVVPMSVGDAIKSVRRVGLKILHWFRVENFSK